MKHKQIGKSRANSTLWWRLMCHLLRSARSIITGASATPYCRVFANIREGSYLIWTELNWIELDWFWLNWIELNWIDLNWIELNWIGLDWIELNWIELNWIGLDWFELDWIDLNWIGLIWIGLDWFELSFGFVYIIRLYTMYIQINKYK